MDFRELLIEKNYTPTQLSKETGISRETLTKLNAKKFRPSLETLDRLRAVFHDDLDRVD